MAQYLLSTAYNQCWYYVGSVKGGLIDEKETTFPVALGPLDFTVFPKGAFSIPCLLLRDTAF